MCFIMKEIVLAGGCFWGIEQYIQGIYGVKTTQVGYANGITENPSYEEVCTGLTGHAEAVKIIYDENLLPLSFLLNLFYKAIDPTTINRQGGDIGPQYRTGIYYQDPLDRPFIDASIQKLQETLNKPVVIEVKSLKNFYTAEEYHQKYLDKNPGGYCHINPQLIKQVAEIRVNPSDYKPADTNKLKDELTPLQYEVTMENATEPPFENAFWNNHKKGLYVDITTGEPLFISSDQFDSGCGWPSFSKPIDPTVIHELDDNSLSRSRTEVRSRVGNIHLGHVFEDGPEELGGLRYCINSASLKFIPVEEMAEKGYEKYMPFIR